MNKQYLYLGKSDYTFQHITSIRSHHIDEEEEYQQNGQIMIRLFHFPNFNEFYSDNKRISPCRIHCRPSALAIRLAITSEDSSENSTVSRRSSNAGETTCICKLSEFKFMTFRMFANDSSLNRICLKKLPHSSFSLSVSKRLIVVIALLPFPRFT